ncbi:hypothetical protein [Kitasatospora azatica]|uniref:hypothetical protein n=1 Tax=Kitasatospora azatica TaxID=58347 RepID=UPI0005611BE7|nr:hypothetical protein [Kitasatospora azatica]
MATESTGWEEWPVQVSEPAGRDLRAALARGTGPAGRAGALIAAAEAAALLADRSVPALPAEAELTKAVLAVTLPQLIAPGLPLADVQPLVGHFPQLVRGFAAELVDRDGLAAAVLGRPAADPSGPLPARGCAQSTRSCAQSTRGCSAVQALPGLLRTLPGRGAPRQVLDGATALLAAGDELHRRMAETRSAAETAARPLAEAYGTLYAGAAALHLWAAYAEARAAHPLWAQAGWLRAVLAELAVRLAGQLGEPVPYPVEALDGRRYGALMALAARTHAPLTPFGSPKQP